MFPNLTLYPLMLRQSFTHVRLKYGRVPFFVQNQINVFRQKKILYLYAQAAEVSSTVVFQPKQSMSFIPSITRMSSSLLMALLAPQDSRILTRTIARQAAVR